MKGLSLTLGLFCLFAVSSAEAGLGESNDVECSKKETGIVHELKAESSFKIGDQVKPNSGSYLSNGIMVNQDTSGDVYIIYPDGNMWTKSKTKKGVSSILKATSGKTYKDDGTVYVKSDGTVGRKPKINPKTPSLAGVKVISTAPMKEGLLVVGTEDGHVHFFDSHGQERAKFKMSKAVRSVVDMNGVVMVDTQEGDLYFLNVSKVFGPSSGTTQEECPQ
ncbi:MAG: hypothetical protein OXB88_05390 [Bacteriovoracales bacterium]|nr:hypothetical protein [Bacteriovoracales bacterium]